MTTLGIDNAPAPKKELPAWSKMLANGSVFGGGLVGAGAIVLSIVGLIRANPDKGFQLLEKWGPWFILATIGVVSLNTIANRILEIVHELGSRYGDSMDRIADEQKNLADSARDQAAATQRAADRDDRDTERISTLVEYSAQQSRQALEGINAIHIKLDKWLEKGS